VRQNVEPVETKVGQMADENVKQGERIGAVEKGVEENDVEISAAKERITTVEGQTTEALSRTDRNSRALDALRQQIANIDDYKVATEGTVHFGFDKDTLTEVGQAELDRLVTNAPTGKRFFIAVEGFTDPIGSPDYNLNLSRRRADRVVQYLVTKHNIPVYRIFVIGLGENRLVDEEKTREARAKNRRVEIRVFSAGGEGAVASRD
jgi:outer membrane protein OmpA-like peptidoglycan-associated protein